MRKITLGKSGLLVTKTSFGALPVQRLSLDDGAALIRSAYDRGITLFDTARAYTDSEEKIGLALADVRENVVLATKTHAATPDEMSRHLETSLRLLKTDYIDLYQFHNPETVPLQGDPRWERMEDFKRQGLVRHIGITSHSADRALTAARSGLYETVQYPVSCISDDRDLGVVAACRELGVGMLGMKAMCGGLVPRAALSFAVLDPYDHLAPIWGIQHLHELEELAALDAAPPVITDELMEEIDRVRTQLRGSFCRACGYCLAHCPQGIAINTCARMELLCGRAVWQSFMTDEWNDAMERIETCLHCGACTAACPYGLDTPALLRRNLDWYRSFRAQKGYGPR